MPPLRQRVRGQITRIISAAQPVPAGPQQILGPTRPPQVAGAGAAPLRGRPRHGPPRRGAVLAPLAQGAARLRAVPAERRRAVVRRPPRAAVPIVAAHVPLTAPSTVAGVPQTDGPRRTVAPLTGQGVAPTDVARAGAATTPGGHTRGVVAGHRLQEVRADGAAGPLRPKTHGPGVHI